MATKRKSSGWTVAEVLNEASWRRVSVMRYTDGCEVYWCAGQKAGRVLMQLIDRQVRMNRLRENGGFRLIDGTRVRIITLTREGRAFLEGRKS